MTLLGGTDSPRIVENYLAFVKRAEVARFRAADGKVFIATEGRSEGEIRALLQIGHRHFAEKYWQEIQKKWPSLLSDYPDVTLNFFGRLQTNKAHHAFAFCSGIESLDRPNLATRLQTLLARDSIAPEIWVQVNIGKDPAKAGVMPDEAPHFIQWCRDELNIPISGLMTIPPLGEAARPYFSQLKKMCDQFGFRDCMMGMSNDYLEAIEEGATAIRIGRLIFN